MYWLTKCNSQRLSHCKHLCVEDTSEINCINPTFLAPTKSPVREARKACFSTRSSSHLCLIWCNNRPNNIIEKRQRARLRTSPVTYLRALFPSGQRDWFSISIGYAIFRAASQQQCLALQCFIAAKKMNKLFLHQKMEMGKIIRK